MAVMNARREGKDASGRTLSKTSTSGRSHIVIFLVAALYVLFQSRYLSVLVRQEEWISSSSTASRRTSDLWGSMNQWMESREASNSTSTGIVQGDSPLFSLQGQEEHEAPKQRKSQGVVILNMLGYLGNNVFEIGFANRMALELDWQIAYRSAWRSPFFVDPKPEECYPNAFLKDSNSTEAFESHPMLQGSGVTMYPPSVHKLDAWLERYENQTQTESTPSRQQPALVQVCRHRQCDFANIPKFVEPLKDPNSTVQALYLHAFFIHGGWLQEDYWRKQMAHWFAPMAKCCPSPMPPENAIVIHVRDFESDPDKKNGHQSRTVHPSVYRHIMQHYNMLVPSRPVWVVCQPGSVHSTMVLGLQELLRPSVQEVRIITGEDAYDAFCIIQRAKTVLVSYGSTFSQAATLSSIYPNPEVHVPMVGDISDVTVHIPTWKYHHVEPTSKASIKEFDAPKERFQWKLD